MLSTEIGKILACDVIILLPVTSSMWALATVAKDYQPIKFGDDCSARYGDIKP